MNWWNDWEMCELVIAEFREKRGGDVHGIY